MEYTKLIKKLVENRSGMEDLSKDTREREFVYLRWVCYALCTELTNDTLSRIGYIFKQKHNIVIRGRDEFNKNKDQSYFGIYNKVYNDVKEYFTYNYDRFDSNTNLLNEIYIDMILSESKEVEDVVKFYKLI